MAILTVRIVPDDIHSALRVRAAQNGRSTEAEVREILAVAVKPAKRVQMGDALATLGKRIGWSQDDVEAMTQGRDRKPAEPMGFP